MTFTAMTIASSVSEKKYIKISATRVGWVDGGVVYFLTIVGNS